MKYTVLPLVFFQALSGLFSASVSGIVSRAEGLDPLQYVNVRVAESKAGIQTNKKGYYQINIAEPGEYTLQLSLIGYASHHQSFRINTADDQLVINVQLSKRNIELDKVMVTAISEAEGPFIPSSLIRQSAEQVQNVVSPVEADVFRAVLSLPGVAPISDFSSGLYVRGGSPDQNLILLDNIDVYNPNHFGGVFSTFNADAVDNIDLMKGAYPALYGGRLSSVLALSSRQGDRSYHQGVARLSAISSSATLEGPFDLFGIRGSYMGSGRRTYLELVKTIYDELPDYYFYDGHLKLFWDLGQWDKLTTSAYFGRDKLRMDFGPVIKLDWGNRTFSSQLLHSIKPQVFSMLTLAGSEYTSNFSQSNSQNESVMSQVNGIQDLSAKFSISHMPAKKYYLEYGAESKYNYIWMKTSTSQQYDPNGLPNIKVSSLSSAGYIHGHWKINALWELQPGLRLSWYRSLKINLPQVPQANYVNLEPRLSLRHNLDIHKSMHFSFGSFNQYMSLMGMDISTPFDVWMPLDGSLKPGNSLHYVLGYRHQLSDHFIYDAELYYKSYRNLLEYDDAAQFSWDNQTGTLSDVFRVGTGRSFGVDLLLRNDWRGVEGFLGITLANTKRKMEGFNLDPYIMEGVAFYPKYDRSFGINLVETWNCTANTGREFLGSNLKLGINFTANSGQPAAKPERIYYDGEIFKPIYSYRDRIRLPHYLRLDLSTKMEYSQSWGTIEPYFEIINVLNRKNVGSRSYAIELDEDGRLQLSHRDSAQFPILPFFGVNVKW